MYFHTELDKTKKNSRETWKIIRSVLPSKSSREAPSSVRLNNMTTSEDPTTVANKFNNFFCTVGQNLAEKIEQVPNKRPEDFFDENVISSCYLDPPTLTEVFDRIIALKDKAVGHDNVPSFFLKAARHVITPYLHQLIKYVFTEGLFPRSCKIARIAPIYKNGAKDETTNYRLISVLTCFSKIIEKLMYVWFIKFIKKHKIIHPNQYGFQSKVSTVHAMLDVVTSSYNHINRNHFTALVFVDLKKAFDTVSHRILTKKLSNYGFRGKAYTLILSYLTNRKQFVLINQFRSHFKDKLMGYPRDPPSVHFYF